MIEVLAVDGKVVANRDAATRSERQIFALPIVLHHVQRNLECLEPRARGRQTRREPRDLTRHRQVALEVRRRNREDVREVVEAAVRRLVARQQRLHVDVEREQVANRVVVFRAIETMDGVDPARIRIGRPRPIDFGLQPAGHGVIGGRIGPRPSRAAASSRPEASRSPAPRPPHWRQASSTSRLSSASPAVRSRLVMAGDAVLVEDLPRRGKRRGDRPTLARLRRVALCASS